MKELDIHRLALQEASRALVYFRNHGKKPVTAFLLELNEAYEKVRLSPKQGSPVYDAYRFIKLKKYRYTIYYKEIRPDFVYVFAVAHDSRRPGYWLRRTKRK